MHFDWRVGRQRRRFDGELIRVLRTDAHGAVSNMFVAQAVFEDPAFLIEFPILARLKTGRSRNRQLLGLASGNKSEARRFPGRFEKNLARNGLRRKARGITFERNLAVLGADINRGTEGDGEVDVEAGTVGGFGDDAHRVLCPRHLDVFLASRALAVVKLQLEPAFERNSNGHTAERVLHLELRRL